MFSKIVALCGLVAVCQAGLLTAPVQYSSAAAVSSQNIVRHDQPALRASIAYQAAPAAYAYRAAPAAVAYNAPARYSSAAAVSSQNIVRHDQPALRASIAYQAAPAAYAYRAAPAAIAYNAPARYSSAASVSSQNIVRHDQPAQRVAIAAPIAYNAAPAAYNYRAAVAPVAYSAAPIVAQAADYNAHPKYEYNYSVADSHTGDNKSQQESRDGDVVRGSYSLHEADGSIRTVEYSADAHSGFNAVVHNTAPRAAPVLVKAAPAYVAAPARYYQH